MARAADRDVDTRASQTGRGEEPRGGGGSAVAPAGERLRITRISDEDYRSVWRPCHALEEDEGGDPAT